MNSILTPNQIKVIEKVDQFTNQYLYSLPIFLDKIELLDNNVGARHKEEKR